MSIPPQANKLGKKAKDLCGFDAKGFKLENISKASDGVEFTSTAKGKAGPFEAGTFKMVFPGVDVGKIEVNAGTDGKGSVKVTNKNLHPGLSASLAFASAPKAEINLDYGMEQLAVSGTATVDLSDEGKYGTVFDAKASAGVIDNLTLGGTVKVDLKAEQKVADFGVAAEFTQGPFIASLNTKKFSTFLLGGHYGFDKSTNFATRLTCKLPSPPKKDAKETKEPAAKPKTEVSLDVAMSRKLDDKTTAKLRVSYPSFIVKGSVEYKLKNPSLKFGMLTTLNMKAKADKFNSAGNWGVWATFGDY